MDAETGGGVLYGEEREELVVDGSAACSAGEVEVVAESVHQRV